MRTGSIMMLVVVAVVIALALAIHLFGGNLAATLHGR